MIIVAHEDAGEVGGIFPNLAGFFRYRGVGLGESDVKPGREGISTAGHLPQRGMVFRDWGRERERRGG